MSRDILKNFREKMSGHFEKYAFEKRNNLLIRQYSSAFTIAFNKKLNGMIERRMRQSIFSVASFWYTAWVNAGQPNLKQLTHKTITAEDQHEFDRLNQAWLKGKALGKDCD